ncbi:GyrI-like domain-containing protein [Ornithinibacillus scapharcae]|uniref:GyrI-like domain-containing protein n=1 Tax=Ornithinibacillus scapharcae TaxID=1147159 RepID=UPI000225BA37|nr:effector binding domain-containing protein [Ornithinibacillus scapharcae]
MGPKIIKKDSFQLIGYRLSTNLKEINEHDIIHHAATRLKEKSIYIHNKVRDKLLILQIYPMKEEFNPVDENFNVIVGYEVNNAEDTPENTVLFTVESNMYVNCKHNGSRTDLYKTYDFLYNDWLQKNRCTPLGFEMEVWNEKSDSEVEVCIPITKYM